MKQKAKKPNFTKKKSSVNEDVAVTRISLYPAEEDLYNKLKNEENVDPDNINELKSTNEEAETPNEKDFEQMMSGSDLDIPGSELDNDLEDIGSEDEENNYYSLGGEVHNNLDEDNG